MFTLHHQYSRRDIHELTNTPGEFTPSVGRWGLSGIVTIPSPRDNEMVFFVTFGHKEGEHEFQEEITEDGVLAWQSQPKQKLVHPQIQKMINHVNLGITIHLMLRTSKKHDYTYLGELEYLNHDPNRETPVWFNWQILDWTVDNLLFERIGLRLSSAYDEYIDNRAPVIKETPSNSLTESAEKPKARKAPSSSVRSGSVKIDYETKQRRNADIGLRGEKLVMLYELERLEKLNSTLEPKHISLTDDSKGYDIVSYDESGNEFYIEVKTTIGSIQSPFFVTKNEVDVSQQKGSSYVVYRLFNFNVEKNSAEFYKIDGPLTNSFQLVPQTFKAYYQEDSENPTSSRRESLGKE